MIDNKAYVRQAVDEYFKEYEFEEFLHDTAELIMTMEKRIEDLEEKLNGKTT